MDARHFTRIAKALADPTRFSILERIAGEPDFQQQVTSKTPLDRLGRPEDIAATVAFLSSPDATWITGQVIDASGGLRL